MQFPVKRLLSKLLRLTLSALRRVPIFARFEYRQYEAVEKQLSQAEPHVIRSFFPVMLLDKHGIRESFSRNTNYRIIDIDNLTDDDQEFFKKNELCATHIAANKLHLPAGKADKRLSYQPIDPFDNTFQWETLEPRSIKAVCPKSGALLESNRSLLPEPNHTIFYRFFENDHVFYLAVGREWFIKLYLYFPLLQTIVLLGHKDWAWLGRWEVDQFRAFIVANWKDVLVYVKKQTMPVMCALVDQAHFAHHMWNTLSGLQSMITNRCVCYIDKVVVTAEPMGPIDRIFPELQSSLIERMSNSEIITLAIRNNLFLVRPGGDTVNKDIADRLYRVAVEKSTPDLTRTAQDFRKAHWPILWVTIRTGNRTWVSQAEGIAGIANKLKQVYRNFALIVDGYAIPHGQRQINPHQERLIRDEEEVTGKIRELLDQSIEMHVNVGKPIFESVIYSRAIDFYLAHHGSLQNKIAWLTNKPGVVHSNKKVLSGINGTKLSYAAFNTMKNGVHPVYLDPEPVTDAPGATQKKNMKWNDPLDNYDFDYHYAFTELVKIVEALQTSAYNNIFSGN